MVFVLVLHAFGTCRIKDFSPISADMIMQHDWILDVLEDLRSYAEKNGLSATAAKAEEAMRVARAEMAAEKELAATGAGLCCVRNLGRPN